MVISFWFFTQVLIESYPEKAPYQGVEVRFNNIADIRTANYILRKQPGQFLLASGAPRDLKIKMEFISAGNFSAVISSQYPDWLCEEAQLDKSRLLLQGGSLNKTINLVRGKSSEVNFSISKGQSLKFNILNRDNSECGRAIVEFYEVNNYNYFTVLFVLFWTSIFLFCWYNRASPYTAMLGVLASFLFIAGNATIETLGTNGLTVNTIGGVALVAALLLFSAIPLSSKLLTILVTASLIVILIVPAAFIAYSHVFGAALDAEAIHGAMQSYDTQMIEFWQQYVGKRRTLYFILGLTVLYGAVRHINSSKPNSIPVSLCGLLLLCLSLMASAGRTGENTIINLLTRSILEYKWEIEAFKKVSSARKLSTTTAIRGPLHTDDRTVIVIGESVNKKHMSAYGYPRGTTPLMDKRIAAGEVIQFNRAYSNHTHSNPTMSLILTQANQYNKQSWLESPSVFNYARSANVETNWLTNHRLLGGWSNHITTIVKESDRLKTINYKIGYGSSSSHYDHELIPLYKDALQKHKRQLTFLHLYNSHTSYCDRYPEDQFVLNADERESVFGNLKQLKNFSIWGIACYDNTIFYTDKVLNELIQELEKKVEPSVLVYVADHAEEIVGGLAHNSANFTFDMINIPLFIWANDAWQQKHPELWTNLHANKNKVVTNDLMFESILGIAGIKDPSIDTRFDISSASYQSLDKPLTLHGRMNIDHPENWNYWQSQNSLIAAQDGVELVANNIRSIGEGLSALQYGISSIQINAEYSPESGIVFSGVDTLNLSEFLQSLADRELKKLLIIFSDGSLNTEGDLGAMLEQLEKAHQIKIIEIKNKPKTVRDLSAPKLMVEISSLKMAKPVWVNIKTRYRNSAPVAR